RPAHLSGVGPQGSVCVDIERRADNTQLQALQVSRFLDFMFGIAQLAVAVLTPGEWYHSGAFQPVEEAFSDLALDERVDGRVVGHQERQREQVELADLWRPVDGRPNGHVDHALTDGVEFAGLVPLNERGSRIDLD